MRGRWPSVGRHGWTRQSTLQHLSHLGLDGGYSFLLCHQLVTLVDQHERPVVQVLSLLAGEDGGGLILSAAPREVVLDLPQDVGDCDSHACPVMSGWPSKRLICSFINVTTSWRSAPLEM